MTNPFNAGIDTSLSKASEARTQARMTNLRNRLMGGADKNDPKKLKQACQDFEAVFMNKIWQKMRATVPKAGYLHSRFEDQYISMFDNEMSKKFASAGGIGLADMMFSQLSQKLSQKSQSTAPGGSSRPLDRTDTLPGKPSVPTETVENIQEHPQTRFNDPALLAGAELTHRVNSLAARIEMQMAGGEDTALAENDRQPTSVAGGTLDANASRATMPASGSVITPFGWSSDPDSGSRHYSPAVEVAVNSGSQIAAVQDGQVAYAGKNATEGDVNGHMVIINHGNGLQSRYQFNGDLKVHAGEHIEVGKAIAVIEQDNPDTPAALRFELRRNGQSENPESLVNQVVAARKTITGQHTG